jgi:nitroreductase
MELHETIRRRAMVRRFTDGEVEPETVRRLLDSALRSPTAGNSAGTAWVALVGSRQTEAYWSATTDAEWRDRNPELFEGLHRAPVILLSYCSPNDYVARYAEADKADPRLGSAAESWPVPYWHGDAAFGVMAVLLGAVDAGLGACVLGAFKGTQRLADVLGVPEGWELFCAVALGHPDRRQRRSRSLGRERPSVSARVHWGNWGPRSDQDGCDSMITDRSAMEAPDVLSETTGPAGVDIPLEHD